MVVKIWYKDCTVVLQKSMVFNRLLKTLCNVWAMFLQYSCNMRTVIEKN